MKRKHYTLEEILEKITANDFINFYKNHTVKEVYLHFNITDIVLKKLCDIFNYEKSKEDILKTRNRVIIEKYGSLDNFKKLKDIKCKETKLRNHGSATYNNIEKAKQTKLEKYGDEFYSNHEKASITCKERYGGIGFGSEILTEKYKNTMLMLYGVDHNWKSKDENLNGIKTRKEKYGDEFYSNHKKASETMLKKYGVKYYCIHPICREKVYSKETSNKREYTHRKNKSFNISKDEERLYNLLINKYGENDIIRNYKSEFYPFLCDFYIKSKNQYIELNYHWTHGKYPFDLNNNDDILILEKWKEKAKTSNFYKNAINVWTNLDVKKQQIAKQNNLNYITIYSGDKYDNI